MRFVFRSSLLVITKQSVRTRNLASRGNTAICYTVKIVTKRKQHVLVKSSAVVAWCVLMDDVKKSLKEMQVRPFKYYPFLGLVCAIICHTVENEGKHTCMDPYTITDFVSFDPSFLRPSFLPSFIPSFLPSYSLSLLSSVLSS